MAGKTPAPQVTAGERGGEKIVQLDKMAFPAALAAVWTAGPRDLKPGTLLLVAYELIHAHFVQDIFEEIITYFQLQIQIATSDKSNLL